MGPLEVLVLLLLYVLPSVLVAKYAERKGQSFALFLVLGLLVSWIVSLIVAVVMRDQGEMPGSASRPEARSEPPHNLPPPPAATATSHAAAPSAPQPSGAASTQGPDSPDLATLERLNELRLSGALTDEEFEVEKTKVLGRGSH